MSLVTGEVDAADFGVALGVVRGSGVALGTSNRPRRCDGVSDADAEEIGVEVAKGVADCSAVADLPPALRSGVAGRGVITGLGVDVAIGAAVAAADGAGVAVVDLDVAEVSPASVEGLDVAAVFINFFGGAFGGGVASDFIFSRAFFASS